MRLKVSSRRAISNPRPIGSCASIQHFWRLMTINFGRWVNLDYILLFSKMKYFLITALFCLIPHVNIELKCNKQWKPVNVITANVIMLVIVIRFQRTINYITVHKKLSLLLCNTSLKRISLPVPAAAFISLVYEVRGGENSLRGKETL